MSCAIPVRLSRRGQGFGLLILVAIVAVIFRL
jgi:hypothetical protein